MAAQVLLFFQIYFEEKMPDDVEPEALVAMGYPGEKPVMPPRRLFGNHCFEDTWEGKLG